MAPRLVTVLVVLVCVGGVLTANGQPTHDDLSSQLQSLTVAVEEVGDEVDDLENDVEGLEDEVEDIADDVEENIEDELEDFKEGIEEELEAVGQQVVSLREEVKSLRSYLETGLQDLERKMVSHTLRLVKSATAEIQADLQNSTAEIQADLQNSTAEIQADLQNSTAHALHHLKEQLAILRQDIGKDLEDKKVGVAVQYLASSCIEISELHLNVPSGYYWVHGGTGSPVYVYCDMARDSCGCGSSRVWMRVAHLDMADPSQQCPSGFRLRTSPKRMCERTSAPGCTSITFPAHGVQYSRVCGRVRGYQYRSPDAFASELSIDGAYVDGISITHGHRPRKHIWTFAAALDETGSNAEQCPCTYTARSYTGRIPSFVGNDYFCDSGSQYTWDYNGILYIEDPLWDGKGCGPTSSCCQFNSPPWFCKELPHTTTDSIEVRVCDNQGLADEDTPIDLIELYVQ